MLNRLRREFETQLRVCADPLSGKNKGSAATTPERIEQVQLMLARLANARTNAAARRQAIEELREFGPALNDTLATVSIDGGQPLDEIVYTEVLPSSDPVFEALYKLTSNNVIIRRNASTRLVSLATERRLHRLATARLAALIVRETDQLIWQNALRAVVESTEPPIYFDRWPFDEVYGQGCGQRGLRYRRRQLHRFFHRTHFRGPGAAPDE